MIQPPASMIQELSAWNNGKGIDLESWTGCSGNFKLAVGYSTIFWPKFNLDEDYIFEKDFVLAHSAILRKNKMETGKLLKLL
jgi:hypothetical protein